MSRAISIWVVTNMRHPVGAFTVKHQLISWLRKMQVQYGDISTYAVSRYRDGEPSADRKYYKLEDLLKERNG